MKDKDKTKNKNFSFQIMKSADLPPNHKANRLFIKTPEGALHLTGNDNFVVETVKDLINANGFFAGELRKNLAGVLPAEFENAINAEYERIGLPAKFKLTPPEDMLSGEETEQLWNEARAVPAAEFNEVIVRAVRNLARCEKQVEVLIEEVKGEFSEAEKKKFRKGKVKAEFWLIALKAEISRRAEETLGENVADYKIFGVDKAREGSEQTAFGFSIPKFGTGGGGYVGAMFETNRNIKNALSDIEEKVFAQRSAELRELENIAEVLVKDFNADVVEGINNGKFLKPVSAYVKDLLAELAERRRSRFLPTGIPFAEEVKLGDLCRGNVFAFAAIYVPNKPTLQILQVLETGGGVVQTRDLIKRDRPAEHWNNLEMKVFRFLFLDFNDFEPAREKFRKLPLRAGTYGKVFEEENVRQYFVQLLNGETGLASAKVLTDIALLIQTESEQNFGYPRFILEQTGGVAKFGRADYKNWLSVATAIPDDEPVFILRAQDKFAPETILAYCEQIQAAGGETEIVGSAIRHADRFRAWQKENYHKLPDIMPTNLPVSGEGIVETNNVEILGRAADQNRAGEAFAEYRCLSSLVAGDIFAVSSVDTESGIAVYEVLSNRENEVSARFIGNDPRNDLKTFKIQNFGPASTFEVVLIDRKPLPEEEAAAPPIAGEGLIAEADKIAKFIKSNFSDFLNKEFPTGGKIGEITIELLRRLTEPAFLAADCVGLDKINAGEFFVIKESEGGAEYAVYYCVRNENGKVEAGYINNGNPSSNSIQSFNAPHLLNVCRLRISPPVQMNPTEPTEPETAPNAPETGKAAGFEEGKANFRLLLRFVEFLEAQSFQLIRPTINGNQIDETADGNKIAELIESFMFRERNAENRRLVVIECLREGGKTFEKLQELTNFVGENDLALTLNYLRNNEFNGWRVYFNETTKIYYSTITRPPAGFLPKTTFCDYCGTDLANYPAAFEHGNQFYCSVGCKALGLNFDQKTTVEDFSEPAEARKPFSESTKNLFRSEIYTSPAEDSPLNKYLEETEETGSFCFNCGVELSGNFGPEENPLCEPCERGEPCELGEDSQRILSVIPAVGGVSKAQIEALVTLPPARLEAALEHLSTNAVCGRFVFEFDELYFFETIKQRKAKQAAEEEAEGRAMAIQEGSYTPTASERRTDTRQFDSIESAQFENPPVEEDTVGVAARKDREEAEAFEDSKVGEKIAARELNKEKPATASSSFCFGCNKSENAVPLYEFKGFYYCDNCNPRNKQTAAERGKVTSADVEKIKGENKFTEGGE